MRMFPAGPIEIPHGQTVMLKLGGLHMMMMKLNSALRKGKKAQLVRTFEWIGKITVLAPIFTPRRHGAKVRWRKVHSNVRPFYSSARTYAGSFTYCRE